MTYHAILTAHSAPARHPCICRECGLPRAWGTAKQAEVAVKDEAATLGRAIEVQACTCETCGCGEA